MSIVEVNGKPRRLGFIRPTPANHALRASMHFGDGFGKTPEQKGFVIKDEADLTPLFPSILDQGDVGDCVSNGGNEAMEGGLQFYHLLPPQAPRPFFSRYYIYAKTRADIMGVPLTDDTGSTITDMVRAVERFGACPESVWPSTDPNGWRETPSPQADAEALKHRLLRAYALNDVAWICASLSLGIPVVFGVSLFESFMDIGKDGYMPMPGPVERCIGGHCMTIVAYKRREDGKVNFVPQNSWGPEWAMGGRCIMPQEYFDSMLALDAYGMHQVTG